MPPPTPPIVNDGRMIDGKPVRATAAIASSSVLTTADAGVSMPISVIASRNSCRSSATLIASTEAPISFTPYFARTPCSSSSMARLSAVWPPTVGSTASGLSRSMILATTSTVSGST